MCLDGPEGDHEGRGVVEEVVGIVAESGAELLLRPLVVGIDRIEVAKLQMRLGVLRMQLNKCLEKPLRVLQVPGQCVGAGKEAQGACLVGRRL